MFCAPPYPARAPLVRERMSSILAALEPGAFTDFVRLFSPAEGRMGVTVSFVAILELLREGLIEIVQTEALAPLHVRRATACPYTADRCPRRTNPPRSPRVDHERAIHQERGGSGSAGGRTLPWAGGNWPRCSARANGRAPRRSGPVWPRSRRSTPGAGSNSRRPPAACAFQVRREFATEVSRLWPERPQALFARTARDTGADCLPPADHARRNRGGCAAWR